MNEFSDKRADAAFLAISKLIAEFRNAHTEYKDTEMAFAMLQTCVCIDDGVDWQSFLREALDECIYHENAAS